MKTILHPSVIGQAVSLLSSILLVAFLTRLLPTSEYAAYVSITALWAVGNAFAGTGAGTRIAQTAATGASRVKLLGSEILWILVTGAAIGLYVAWAFSNALAGVLSALGMLSFLVVEVRMTFELGRKRFSRYLIMLCVRVGSPVIILAFSSIQGDGLDLYLAIMATTFGNLLPALFWIRGYGLPVWQNPGLNGYAVGTVNLGLWVIASADRVILERLAIPVVVATYALTYGLLDKGFRSLANIMVTRFLGDAFSTGNLRIPRKFYGVTCAGAVVSVPLAVILSDLVSAGAYVLDWRITTILTMALLFMVWSTPGYLLLLRRGRFRTSVCVVLLLATINIVMNLLLAQQLGALGAAGSSLVSYLTWFIWTKLASRRHTV